MPNIPQSNKGVCPIEAGVAHPSSLAWTTHSGPLRHLNSRLEKITPHSTNKFQKAFLLRLTKTTGNR